MPTPVSTARQCLTLEAANALDEAVNVARRRNHAQTTSLHVVSALLSLPTSSLRDACARARNSAYSPRLQFKALELCLSVSLDRVQASQLSHRDNSDDDNSNDPPVSNSLMAAIKRAQANQRRQPESFQFYSHQQQNNHSCYSPSISNVKVELRILILSILDDPVVSRVFGESGFHSPEIKLAILRPLPQVLKFSRYKGPPMFLCNLNQDLNFDPARVGLNIPGYNGFLDEDENCRRIGEVLMRNKGRNPLLVGVYAYDALLKFCEAIEQRKESSFWPGGLSKLKVICIESEIKRLLLKNDGEGFTSLKFDEIDRVLERNLGAGLVVNFGDLKVFCSEGDLVSSVVEKLTRMMRIHGGRLWLIGVSANYEMYLKFISRFRDVEKDWDLQLLPITSRRNDPVVGSFPTQSSLMKSFVPLGGFFSAPDTKGVLSSSYEYQTCCPLCNQKCEQEVHAIVNGEFMESIADQYQSSLQSWSHMAELCTSSELNTKVHIIIKYKNATFHIQVTTGLYDFNYVISVQIRDDGAVLTTKVIALRKKWASVCQLLHHTQVPASENTFPIPTMMGFQLVNGKKEDAISCSTNDANALLNGFESGKQTPGLTVDLNFFKEQLDRSSTEVCQAETLKVQSKQCENTSSISSPNIGEGSRGSTSSITSVTTELGLRVKSYPSHKELTELAKQKHELLSQDLSALFPAKVDSGHESIEDPLGHSPSCFSRETPGQSDPSNFKLLFQVLSEKVGWQNEAIRAICQTISCCRKRNEKLHGASTRGDIWFIFLGPDRVSKKKVAITLAEMIYGSTESFISADLSIHDQEANVNDTMSRGKTLVDFVAGRLNKKPLSVVFLENADKADVQAQSSLSHANRTGKFPDSHGKEVGINNSIFVLTSTYCRDDVDCLTKSSEERILKVEGRPIKTFIVEPADNRSGQDITLSLAANESISTTAFFNKRKTITADQNVEGHGVFEVSKRAHKSSTLTIDLNLPAEVNGTGNYDGKNSDNDCTSEDSHAWLQNFSQKVDSTVVFKPFDFEILEHS